MRIKTDLAIIRRALDITDDRGAYRAAAEIGVHHKTIYKWMARRDVEGAQWPTPADIAEWRADDEAKAELRAKRNVRQRDLRKRVYLNRGPVLRDAIGTVRRIRALYAIGWTCPDMAREFGCSKERIARIMRGSTRNVMPATAQRINDLYNELSMTIPTDPPPMKRGDCPVHKRARRDAQRRGFAPPLAWDDDTIDDPNATSNLGEPTKRPGGGPGRPTAHVVEDIEWFLELNPYVTSTEIAERLGYADATGVQNALKADRGNRPDLLARLARNAEVAA